MFIFPVDQNKLSQHIKCFIIIGKYDPANENPRKWKANFRCALNSLPDVIIVPSLCVRKGKEAYRVFKILAEKIPEKVRESKYMKYSSTAHNLVYCWLKIRKYMHDVLQGSDI